MNKLRLSAALFFLIVLTGCESRFPMEKRFWTPDDYQKVWFELNYNTPKGEEYPRFGNPETEEVIRKVVDRENYRSVLEDPELGLNYRNEVSQKYFEHIQDIIELYGGMDIQDKYIYPQELVELRRFFLGFQVIYFRIGNESIASQSDDTSTMRKNEQSIIGNFNGYLEELRREKAYGQYAGDLAQCINVDFFKLIETFPNANYSSMLSTAKNMQTKVQTKELKDALARLIVKLEKK